MFPKGFLTEHCKLTKVKDHSAAGTADITSSSVDMQGWDGVVFFTSLSVAAADNFMHAEQSQDDSSFADLEGTKVLSGASPSNEDLILDIQEPGDRYVRVVVTPTTSSTVESIWALQYRGRNVPQTNSVSGTQICEQHHAPAEGTP